MTIYMPYKFFFLPYSLFLASMSILKLRRKGFTMDRRPTTRCGRKKFGKVKKIKLDDDFCVRKTGLQGKVVNGKLVNVERAQKSQVLALKKISKFINSSLQIINNLVCFTLFRHV
jgi:predicted transcriptional regulator